jgi:hypothetical protein
MADLTEQRYIELQFYYICVDILNIRNNLMDVMDIIDAFAIFNTYQPEVLKTIAQEVVTSVRYRPSNEEFILLCHKNRVPIKHIKLRTKLANRTLYNLIEADNKDPRLFYPRLPPNKIEIITKFVTIFNNMRKVGLPHD